MRLRKVKNILEKIRDGSRHRGWYENAFHIIYFKEDYLEIPQLNWAFSTTWLAILLWIAAGCGYLQSVFHRMLPLPGGWPNAQLSNEWPGGPSRDKLAFTSRPLVAHIWPQLWCWKPNHVSPLAQQGKPRLG